MAIYAEHVDIYFISDLKQCISKFDNLKGIIDKSMIKNENVRNKFLKSSDSNNINNFHNNRDYSINKRHRYNCVEYVLG